MHRLHSSGSGAVDTGADGQARTLSWSVQAHARLEAERARSGDTPLLAVDLPPDLGVRLYLKDEAAQPTGSLKHRLARALFLYAIANQWLAPDAAVIEASSGSTAISEAYFARLLGLPFIAVLPETTTLAKRRAILAQGGEVRLVACVGEARAEAARLADATGARFLDQFTYAERACDWRGPDALGHVILAQMRYEPDPTPAWVVCGAGTGGTSAALGRYARAHGLPTKLCLADPERSVFHRHVLDRAVTRYAGPPSVIEGVGRAQLEPSFLPELVDCAIAVSDAESIAAAHALSARLGRAVGGSTGTNLWAAARLISDMARRGEKGAVVTFIGDDGARYADTLFDPGWIKANNLDLGSARRRIEDFLDHGVPIFATE